MRIVTYDFSSDMNIYEDFSDVPVKTDIMGLCCDFNELTNLDGLDGFDNLSILYCNFNNLTDVSFLQYVPNLTQLYCGFNFITSLSDLSYATGLTHLGVGYNSLTSLSGLDVLTSLQVLLVNHNSLTALDNLDYTTNLEVLIANDNSLTSLPTTITSLSSLTKLSYYNNNSLMITGTVETWLDSQSGEGFVQNPFESNDIFYEYCVQIYVKESVDKIIDIKLTMYEEQLRYEINTDTTLTTTTKYLLNGMLDSNNNASEGNSSKLVSPNLFLFVWDAIKNTSNPPTFKNLINVEITKYYSAYLIGRTCRIINLVHIYSETLIDNAYNESNDKISIMATSFTLFPYSLSLRITYINTQFFLRGYDDSDVWIRDYNY